MLSAFYSDWLQIKIVMLSFDMLSVIVISVIMPCAIYAECCGALMNIWRVRVPYPDRGLYIWSRLLSAKAPSQSF